MRSFSELVENAKKAEGILAQNAPKFEGKRKRGVCQKSSAQPRFSVLKTSGLRFPHLVCQKELVSALEGQG
jgi:hypothetical protein